MWCTNWGSRRTRTPGRRKTRNEADLIQTRLRKTIEQDLAGDPYAQKVFGELLRQAIAEAAAMFDHPLKQYAVLRAFEQRLQSEQPLEFLQRWPTSHRPVRISVSSGSRWANRPWMPIARNG